MHGCKYHWAFTGSVGLALQGIPLDVDDIDVLVENKDAVNFYNDVLKVYETSPPSYIEVEKEEGGIKTKLSAYVSKHKISNVSVDIISDFHCQVNGNWICPIELEISYVEFYDMILPALTLQRELESFIKTGRQSRTELIMKHISH